MKNLSSISLSKTYHKKDIITATQKALQVINNYQKRISYIQTTQIKKINESHIYFKQIYTNTLTKIQLLSNTQQFYKLQCNRSQINIKIIIKNIRGGQFLLCIGYDRKYPNQFNNDTLFYIKKQVVINLKKTKKNNISAIYFGIHTKNSLLMFNMRIQFIQINDSKNSIINTQHNIQSQMFFSQKSLKRTRSNRSVILQKNKDLIRQLSPKQKQQQLNRKKQLRDQKVQIARLNKQALQQYKIKDRQLMKIGLKCKKLIETYKRYNQELSEKKSQINPYLTTCIYLWKFIFITNNHIQEHQLGINNALRIKSLTIKFKQILIENYQHSRKQIPSQKHRLLMTTHLLPIFISKSITNQSNKKSLKIVLSVFNNLTAGLLINQSFIIAHEYRRKIRTIQKYWVTIYKNRSQMIQMYLNNQLIAIVAKNPKFKSIEYRYKLNNICKKFCYQYQVSQSSKLPTINNAYKMRLQQIQQYKKMNQQIKIYNSKALQKRQKKYLQIPQKPSLPIYRFFRDLDLLKSMLRGWLEVEYRKYSRLMNLQKSKEKQINPIISIKQSKIKITK